MPGEQRVGQRPKLVVRGQRLGVEDVDRGRSDPALAQDADQGGLIDDRSARGVDQDRRGLHQPQFRCGNQPAGALTQHHMDRQHVALGEQLLLPHRSRPVLGGGLGGQVLAPRDGAHPECPSDPRHSGADPAQAQQAEGLAVQPLADRDLPAAAAHRLRLGGQVSCGTEDQRPGVLDGWVGLVTGPAHRDAMPARRRNVDGGVGRAGAHKEPEAGQPLQDLGGESRPLPHGHEHVEPGEVADRVVAIGERLGEDDHLRSERVPVSQARCDVLVVVENRDLHAGDLIRIARVMTWPP